MQSLQRKLVWFSGSGARLASHLGAACALEDAGVVAEQYAGVSGGAIVATFAGLGKAREVSDRILSLTAGDIFQPNIFRENGSIDPWKALLGLAITGGRGLCRLKIKKLLIPLLQGDRKPGNVWALAYDHQEKEITKVEIVGDWGIWLFAANMLEMQSSFPVLNPVETFSDAGLTVHYPTGYHDADESDLYFSVGELEGGKDNIGGRLLESLSRVSAANQSRRGEVGTYITLPSHNGHTEYNPEKMRQSFEAAYQHTKEILCLG